MENSQPYYKKARNIRCRKKEISPKPASYAWCYITEPWRMGKVTYLSKAGRRPKSQPKSVCLIDLTLFLFKWENLSIGISEIMSYARIYFTLTNMPANQQSEQCRQAPHTLVSRIEKSMVEKEILVDFFLDIEVLSSGK